MELERPHIVLIDGGRRPGWSPAALEPMVGHWHNTEVASRGISADGSIEWGEVPAEVYADISVTGGARFTVDPADTHYADTSATRGGPAFLAVYDHGFMRVYLQG